MRCRGGVAECARRFPRKSLPAAVIAIAAALFAPSAASATALPEAIKENMTLTAAGSPYTGSPTIESGVTVKAEPGVRFEVYGITVKGTFKAEGTAEEPVIFTGEKEESKSEWCVIRFEPGSGASVIDHAEVKHGGGCNTGAVGVYGSSPTIHNSTFEENYGYAIKTPEGGSPEIANNRVIGSGSYGIYYKASGTQAAELR